jgi:ribose transport system ATP-binding protein
MSATIAENLTLLSFRRFVRFGLIDHRAERRSVIEAMEQFDVRPAGDPDRELITLSGGNQQKVLMAKWSEMKGMKCLILHEPTQGVDVGAKQTILTHIRRLAAEGAGIILISSEHEELSHLADRVLVMRGGRVTSELRAARAKEITEQCYLAV